MKHSLVAQAFALGLMIAGCSDLSGCTALQAATGTVSDVAPKAMLTAKKALVAAHGLHEAAADLATISANSNTCVSTCAKKVTDYLDRSEAALLAADKLVALGDAPGIQAKIAEATALVAQVDSLAGGGH